MILPLPDAAMHGMGSAYTHSVVFPLPRLLRKVCAEAQPALRLSAEALDAGEGAEAFVVEFLESGQGRR